MHGFKVTMAKGTGKREILETDESHNVTATTLSQWKNSLKSLHGALTANEQAWTAFLTTYTVFNTAATAIYSDRDIDARSILKSLDEGRAKAQAQPPPTKGSYSPSQGIEISKQEIITMLARIENAQALHTNRLEATREYRYYDRKTKQLMENEKKRGSNTTPKDLEKKNRNQKKVMDLAIQLNSITTQLYTELEYIDIERLAITDRATAALLTFQKAVFDSQPAADAISRANAVRIGRRVVPRDEIRQWMPNTLNPANPNPNVPNPNMSNNSIPAPSTPPQMAQGYKQQAYYSQGHADQALQLQHIPSAPAPHVYPHTSQHMTQSPHSMPSTPPLHRQVMMPQHPNIQQRSMQQQSAQQQPMQQRFVPQPAMQQQHTPQYSMQQYVQQQPIQPQYMHQQSIQQPTSVAQQPPTSVPQPPPPTPPPGDLAPSANNSSEYSLPRVAASAQ